MIGLIFATRDEAAPFLAMSGAQPLARRPFERFRLPDGNLRPCAVVISGMGKVAAAAAATCLVIDHHAAVLISAGLCGRLADDLAWTVGDLVRIDAAVEGDSDRFGRLPPAVACDPRWFHEWPAVRLVTSDRPVFGGRRRTRLAALGEVADMEGAAVARVAHVYGLPCAMLKGISDGADDAGRASLTDSIERVSTTIGSALIAALTSTPIDDCV